ncbi:SSH4 [Candida margitis]|uniref:SSH4 n=1 Tax=Candida margitis TaxID=1775924 RepID=UPI002225E933|nr:SSH4 [Candida margitis]KAI5970103.1 SSH4 [Candida margitis]
MVEGEYDDVTLVLSIIVSFSITVILAIVFCAYRIFFSRSRINGEYQSLSSSITDNLLGSHSNDVPREFLNDEESLTHLAEAFDFTGLSPEEQQSYLKGQEFTVNNPPDFTKTRGKTFSLEDERMIKEYGINVFTFEMETDTLNPHYIVADKTELNFNNNDLPYCTTTASLNYPLPVRNRVFSDTIYFETKVFEFIQDPNLSSQHFSIGLITKPYPTSFRLPGYNKFSIAYESTGNLKINKPFPTPLQQHLGEQSQYNALVLPPLQEADVVGFGYVIPTGTLFITRNGKKLLDVMKGCFVDLYPAVGCFSTNAKFQVNLGQSGFVWIEANVRKYGFVSTSDYKKLGGERGLANLPQYNKVLKDNNDKLLDKGEELPPRYNSEEELDFFGRSSNDVTRVGSSAQHMRMNEKPVTKRGGNDDEDEDDEVKSIDGTHVTNEPEEVMDLRERIYEQNIQNDVSEDNQSESVPLLASESGVEYGSSGQTSKKSSKAEPSEAAKGETTHEEREPELSLAKPSDPEVSGLEEPNQSVPTSGESNIVEAPPSASANASEAPQTEQLSATNDTSTEPSSRDVTPGAEGSSTNPTQSKNSKASNKKKKKSGKKGNKKKKRK